MSCLLIVFLMHIKLCTLMNKKIDDSSMLILKREINEEAIDGCIANV